MKASFTYAVRYAAAARCAAPLRTAGAEGDTETVLRSPDGVYFIQGSSLAGAFREWIRANAPEKTDEALFGSQKVRGSLIVSDARFSDAAGTVSRPRLRIDGATGAAAKGGKFDVTHIETGAEFVFSLTWLGDRARLGETAAVEDMLAAMDAGEILLGAQKSNGFGRVRLTTVEKREFDMATPKDREDWLADMPGGTVLKLAARASGGRAVFTLRGRADKLLVKSAAIETSGGKSYTPNLTEAGRPIVPGSSVKGAVRARAEQIAACLGLPETSAEALFGRGAAEGDNGVAGRVRFEDVVLTGNQREKITRIRINRLTGGVIRGGLFVEEPVGGEFTLTAAAPAEDAAGCLLLLYALRDLGLGLYGLGSGQSIGRGYLKCSELTAALPGGRALTVRFGGNGRCAVKDPSGIFAQWRGAVEAMA